MKPVLLLVDLQKDFLSRPALEPPAEELIARVGHLLKGCRELGVPVIHAHTVVGADGEDRMPHWKSAGIWECTAGTPGSIPPDELQPRGQEPVFVKQFYSAFADRSLYATLEELDADTLIVAGVYLHGCVRSTVMDAYELGFEIWVAEDATASTEAVHARVTRDYLADRMATFLSSDAILDRLKRNGAVPRAPEMGVYPVGNIGGDWLTAAHHGLWEHRNPSKWDEILGLVPLASREEVASAAAASRSAQVEWRRVSRSSRSELLVAWATKLAERQADFAGLMALELGKPIGLGHDEVCFAVELLHETASIVAREQTLMGDDPGRVNTRFCPIGVVGVITPWNNPIGIPVGKLGPAIAFGNGVVWKAALQAPRTTRLVLETLFEAGAPPGLVNLLFGGVDTAKQLILRPEVQGISLTGSCATGREAARLCARFPKPFQAELGGNNAAIVMPDAEVERAAQDLALAAFSFSGQRCTATRRFIVHRDIREGFIEALVASINALKLGDPLDVETEVGPVISRKKQTRLEDLVKAAASHGARVLCGGRIPAEWEFGCWFEPTLLDTQETTLNVVQEETFGPIAVLQGAKDLDDALSLLNGVPQGLVASLYSQDPACQERFLEEAKVGILKLNQPTLGAAPGAPFGGWKGSGVGPPEHGVWDEVFYTRPQALYGQSLDEDALS
ncbi:MAG: aldehyde dehydrogenase family protein [Deltaproteobacteria bacterium]|nr:aldehyde dehydrogenase family protein [Deltaproteobacteria bacterium]